MPVQEAAQDVQHSADGSAYEQYAAVASQLAGYFTGGGRTACRAGTPAAATANLASARASMTQTFGPPGRKGVVAGSPRTVGPR